MALLGQPASSSAPVVEIVKKHLEEIDERIEWLERVRSDLRQMVASCNGGANAECSILKGISDAPVKDRPSRMQWPYCT